MKRETKFTRSRKRSSDTTQSVRWSLLTPNETILPESEMLTKLFEGSYKHATRVTNNLRMALREKRLSHSRGNIFRLLADPFVMACYETLTGNNDSIALRDMYAALGILLYTHITGFSFQKSVCIFSDSLEEGVITSIHEYFNHQHHQLSTILQPFFHHMTTLFITDHTICNLTYHQSNHYTLTDALFHTILQRNHQDLLPTLSHHHPQTLLTLHQTYNSHLFTGHQLPCIAFTPPHTRDHPVVPRSYLRPTHADQAANNAIHTTSPHFILDDTPLGISTISAKAVNTPSNGHQHLYAIAVHALGPINEAITRFMYTLPSPLAHVINAWSAIPYRTTFHKHLFTTCYQQRRIVSPRGNSFRATLETHLLAACRVLTIAQGSADWVVLSQYRITSAALYMHCERIRRFMGCQPGETALSVLSHVNSLYRCWFNDTATAMDNAGSKDTVLERIKQRSYIPALFKVGLLALKDKPWLASSPDAICIIDMNLVPGKHTSNMHLPCCVMVNTDISSSFRNVMIMNDVIICEHDDPMLRQLISEQDLGHVIHTMVTTRISACLYVAANETQVLYVVLTLFSDSFLDTAEEFVDTTLGKFVRWAYHDLVSIPDVFNDDQTRVLKSRLPFWRCANEDVTNNSPYMPIQQFQHASEALYLRTQGNDDDARARDRFMDCMNTGEEENIVCDLFKSLAVNAFVAWRMLQKEELLTSRETFKGIDHYRTALKQVQSLPDFIHDLTVELLQKKDESQRERTNPAVVTQDELERLCALAKVRKRHRLHYFNKGDGLKLRVMVKNHPHCKGESDIYCALCGQNRGIGFRGHRSGYKCGYCNVHLCIKIRGRMSCWDAWHCESRLVPRVTRAERVDVVESDAGDGSVKKRRLLSKG